MILNKIDRYNKLIVEVNILEREIYDYYLPIVNELTMKNDIKGLQNLLDAIPSVSSIKLIIYQSLRELKNKK